MDVKRLVWIVVIVLIVAVAFVGGFALGTQNLARVTSARVYGFGPGLGARGFAPSVPFGYAPGGRMSLGFGMGQGMMPGYGRGGGKQPGFAPGRGMGGMPRGSGRMPAPRMFGRSAPRNWRGGWR